MADYLYVFGDLEAQVLGDMLDKIPEDSKAASAAG